MKRVSSHLGVGSAAALLLFGFASMLTSCSETVALSGSTLEPAVVPLRAMPQVFVVPGVLAEERRLADALAQHLATLGYTRVEVLGETDLQARLRTGGAGRAMAIVELMLQRHEDYHYGYASQSRTLCDSMGCFTVPGSGRLGLPSVDATLAMTVRVGPAMVVRQQATLRTVVFADDVATLRQISTKKLERRLEQLIDLQRIWIEAEFYDESEASHALSLAEDGLWQEAAQMHREAAEQSAVPDETRARLLYNAGLCEAFVDEGTNLRALAKGLASMKKAHALASGNSVINHGMRFLRSRQRSARQLHAQRAAAHHNFSVSGLAEQER